MVSELLSTDEVAVALDAVGALEFESHHPLWRMGYRDVTMSAPAVRVGEAILDRVNQLDSISDAERSLLIRALILTGPCNANKRGPRWLPDIMPRFSGGQNDMLYDAFPLYAALRCVCEAHSLEAITAIGDVGQQMVRWSTEGMPFPVMLPSTLACVVGVIESRRWHDKDWLTAITIAQYAELAASSHTKHQAQVLSEVAGDVLIHAGVQSRPPDATADTLRKPLDVWGIALESSERLRLDPMSRNAIVRAYLATLPQGETDTSLSTRAASETIPRSTTASRIDAFITLQ